MNNSDIKANKKRTAVISQSLYLTNLLLLPGLSFLLLLWLFAKHRQQKGWQRIHLFRALQFSVLAGLLLVVIPLIVFLASQQYESTMLIMVLYFVTVHAGLVLIGMLNLARAMSQKLPLF